MNAGKSNQSFKSKVENFIKSLIKKSQGYYDISVKTEENTADITFELLLLMSRIDYENTIKSKGGVNYFKAIEENNNPAEKQLTLANANPLFLLFILGTSEEHFHNSFMKFYQEFDKNKDLYLEEEEFISMISFLSKEDSIGKNKISKCFEKVMPQQFKASQRMERIVKSSSGKTLSTVISKDMFGILQYKNDQGHIKSTAIIDYLKFLPFLLAFFGEIISAKANFRKKHLEAVQGFNEEGERDHTLESNLLEQFEPFGYDLEEKYTHFLNYKEIEKVLMMFRTSNPQTFGLTQLNIVLDELQKKYCYSRTLGNFQKTKLLTKKIIRYLGYRISMHSFCNHLSKGQEGQDPHSIIEEYILWNAVYAEKRFNPFFLTDSFLKYASKDPDYAESLPPFKLEAVFSKFIRKIVPTMTKKSINSIIENFRVISENENMLSLREFASILFELCIFEAEIKVKSYITRVYSKLYVIRDKNKSESPKGSYNELRLRKASVNKSINTIRRGSIFPQPDSPKLPSDDPISRRESVTKSINAIRKGSIFTQPESPKLPSDDPISRRESVNKSINAIRKGSIFNQPESPKLPSDDINSRRESINKSSNAIKRDSVLSYKPESPKLAPEDHKLRRDSITKGLNAIRRDSALNLVLKQVNENSSLDMSLNGEIRQNSTGANNNESMILSRQISEKLLNEETPITSTNTMTTNAFQVTKKSIYSRVDNRRNGSLSQFSPPTINVALIRDDNDQNFSPTTTTKTLENEEIDMPGKGNHNLIGAMITMNTVLQVFSEQREISRKNSLKNKSSSHKNSFNDSFSESSDTSKSDKRMGNGTPNYSPSKFSKLKDQRKIEKDEPKHEEKKDDEQIRSITSIREEFQEFLDTNPDLLSFKKKSKPQTKTKNRMCC